MQVDVLIVGQGIAGSTLAMELIRRNINFIVIDPKSELNASSVSSGLINPITGRNFTKSWMIDELLPEAKEVYRSFEQLLNTRYINSRTIVRTLDDIGQENQWYIREATDGYERFINDTYDGSSYDDHIRSIHALGEVKQSYNVDVKSLIKDFRNFLLASNRLIEEELDYNLLIIHEDFISYKEIRADVMICAEGWRVVRNPYFKDLPFRPVKGEALICKLHPQFPNSNILKFQKFFVPMDDRSLCWIGSNYQWDFEDEQPTVKGRSELVLFLEKHMKTPYEIVKHIAGVRPATKYRKPLIGRHHHHRSLLLFNGLGTKGISLAPYWSRRLLAHILDDVDLDNRLPKF